MLFKKQQLDSQDMAEEIETPIPTTDDLLFNIPVKSFRRP